ncbi:hypothetical protein NEILACOT_04069 [Neisseria lactamica ATCC 23970]|uniref:Uncharacterized protein n=1 Tax=Neisseria lactamica ATCC 23970 TaxID=546265 RepID=D0W964_NEILA|nr:hypothetical protein NEILACOT_04069 [Neisseria lactamica ATCC 23970]
MFGCRVNFNLLYFCNVPSQTYFYIAYYIFVSFRRHCLFL